MSVYLLFEDIKSSKPNVLGVFSSREKAYYVMRDLFQKCSGSLFHVSEFGVDEFNFDF